MPINLQNLHPYKSFILGKLRDGVGVNGLINRILDEIENDVLRLGQAGSGIRVNRQDSLSSAGLVLGGIHYQEEQRPAWTIDPNVVDRHNHLVLACRRGRMVAILLTDSARRNVVFRRLNMAGNSGLAVLQRIPQKQLNAAFVRGAARTLWLTGIHRQTTVKADSKILTGVDLRDALDGLADNSYYFSAVRTDSAVTGITSVIGVSPEHSRLWLGPSRDWQDLSNSTRLVLDHLAQRRQGVAAPLPVLAIPAQDRVAVRRAYAIGLVSPYSMSDENQNDPAIQVLEEFAERVEFRITNATGANVRARVFHDGTDLGSIDFSVDVTQRDRVTWALGGASAGAAVDADYRQVRGLCEAQRRWLKIWYESDHTLSGTALYSMRYRDVVFPGITWVNLAGYHVTAEKPTPLIIGNVGIQGSMFCWVKNVWPNIGLTAGNPGGWLACDDRPHEMADFIHLDDVADPPILSIIHAKPSSNGAPNRTTSLPHFETVLGQAIKNLRHTDRALTARGLRNGIANSVANIVWHNGAPSTRNAMLAALGNVGANYRRRVVIVHPNLTHAEMHTPLAQMDAQRRLRFQQVNTLLVAADATCRGANAEFVVIGEQ